jgi:lysozyme family protein
MAQICTIDEYKKIYNALWQTARTKFQNEIKSRVINTIKDNSDNIIARMDSAWWSIGGKDREAEAKKLAEELWINFGNMWESAILAYYKQS